MPATHQSAHDGGGHWLAPSRATVDRRELLRRTGATVLGLGLLATQTHSVAAYDMAELGNAFPSVELPPELGQDHVQVYVPETGHTLWGSMLDYWRATGAASVYGNPISEPFAAANGYFSQAFERGIFQYRPEKLYTADPIMRLMPLQPITEGEISSSSRPWRPEDPASDYVAGIVDEGGVFVEATGHTISGDFLKWYRFNEGSFYLGSPLSEPFEDRGLTVQHFDGGVLQRGGAGIELAPIAPELIERLGIDTSPVKRNDLPEFDELSFWEIDNPNPRNDPYSLGPKWIQVSVPDQQLWAYQGRTLISSTLVSTGLPPNETERGLFHVRLKYPLQDLAGFTDETGEVLGFGDAPEGTIPYAVEDVPDVMYFNMDAEALHGTYWHSNFGNKMSHGCVNLPLEFAQWLYGWAPLGTAVWVHD